MPPQTKKSLTYVIEHLEPEISEWLHTEYKHASQILGKGNLIFTNVRNPEDVKVLSKFGAVEPKSFSEICNSEQTIVLDVKAKAVLKPEDFAEKAAVVVGGILGDQPPRARTHKFITARLPNATIRNLGRGQFTIDGAIYVAKLVSGGKKLEEIPTKHGLTIRINKYNTVHVPYMFPLENGKPVVHKALIEYLRTESSGKNSSRSIVE